MSCAGLERQDPFVCIIVDDDGPGIAARMPACGAAMESPLGARFVIRIPAQRAESSAAAS